MNMGSYGSSLSTPSTGSGASASGTSLTKNAHADANDMLVLGLLGSGMSMPLQVPGQTADIASNYWPRLQ